MSRGRGDGRVDNETDRVLGSRDLKWLCQGAKTILKKEILFEREQGIVKSKSFWKSLILIWEALKNRCILVCRGGKNRKQLNVSKVFLLLRAL